MFRTEGREKPSPARPPLFGLMATPVFSSPRFATFGCRPIANITCSEAILEPFDRCVVNSLARLSMLLPVAAGQDCDAFLFHLGPHMGADVLIETAQDV